MNQKQRGFSLIEILVALSVFLVIVLFTYKIFNFNKKIFTKVKNEEEIIEYGSSALEKIRIDVLQAGYKLIVPIKLGVLKGLEVKDNQLLITKGDSLSFLIKDASAGEKEISVNNSQKFKKRSKAVIANQKQGEIITITQINQDTFKISDTPLSFNYKKEETSIILLKEIRYFLNQSEKILRRKVNRSPAQPLIEDVETFNVHYNLEKSLVSVSFLLKNNQEKVFETFIVPKNIALTNLQ
ncbi:MAG: PilW family protein [Candidatus Aminicenantia bacterium]